MERITSTSQDFGGCSTKHFNHNQHVVIFPYTKRPSSSQNPNIYKTLFHVATSLYLTNAEAFYIQTRMSHQI